MKRFWLLFLHEFRLLKSTWVIHFVVLVQPMLMFFLMSLVLVHPTFTMYVENSSDPFFDKLLAAMAKVGSPIGEPYIAVELIPPQSELSTQQLVSVETQNGQAVIHQDFNLIDSNLVKNFRNRVTAAALLLWQDELDTVPVEINQIPLLPHDLPYKLYFGVAMLPIAAYLAASLVGGLLAALDFELGTVIEYRMSALPTLWTLSVRFLRLLITSWLAAIILLVVIMRMTGVTPRNPLMILLILSPIALCGGGLGTAVGCRLKKTLPAFVIALASSLLFWLLGNAFGLASGFGGTYQTLSRWVPNTYAVELIFEQFFNLQVGNPSIAWLRLGLFAVFFTLAASLLYTQTMKKGVHK